MIAEKAGGRRVGSGREKGPRAWNRLWNRLENFIISQQILKMYEKFNKDMNAFNFSFSRFEQVS